MPDLAARILVVAGVVRDQQGRVLLAQRPPGSHLAGCWEFPGGKCEPGELPFAALQRELREEIGIEVEAAERLIRVAHDYPEKRVLLDTWTVSRYSGAVSSREGQPLRWATLDELAGLAMPPADLPIIHALRLPQTYLITPEPLVGRESEFLAQLETALGCGHRLVQLRAKRYPAERYVDLLGAVKSVVQGCGAQLLINSAHEWVERCALDGVHLPAAALQGLSQRPLSRSRWVAASCHNRVEIARARALGVDFVTLSPVAQSASHPNVAALGWQGFEQLTETAGMPVFALGGMQARDTATARRHGGQGIAAISALWPQGQS